MLSGSILALILISMILIVAFKSVRIGLISLLPNLLPAIAAFGVWGLLVGEVGVSLSIVMSMTLGIVVDDTIHFLSKYLRARREKNLSAVDAIRYAYSTVGTALWVTTIVLMAGFSVLALSAFRMNAGMGLLTAITIGLALALDFLFLGPLILMTKESNDDQTND
jgi:predicted RND superfamily exporter protein